jgi:serine O-acetyltransferase
MIDHAVGLVVGETTVIGDNVSILHSVTLGGSGSVTAKRSPKVSDGVMISAGAKVIGDITIGEGAKIGAGSLVLHSVAPHVTVAGVPGVVVGAPLEKMPALEMNQNLDN